MQDEINHTQESKEDTLLIEDDVIDLIEQSNEKSTITKANGRKFIEIQRLSKDTSEISDGFRKGSGGTAGYITGGGMYDSMRSDYNDV